MKILMKNMKFDCFDAQFYVFHQNFKRLTGGLPDSVMPQVLDKLQEAQAYSDDQVRFVILFFYLSSSSSDRYCNNVHQNEDSEAMPSGTFKEDSEGGRFIAFRALKLISSTGSSTDGDHFC